MYLQKTATSLSFSANGNGKRKFVFLGRQTRNGSQRLLHQQTCPSMPETWKCFLPSNINFEYTPRVSPMKTKCSLFF